MVVSNHWTKSLDWTHKYSGLILHPSQTTQHFYMATFNKTMGNSLVTTNQYMAFYNYPVFSMTHAVNSFSGAQAH